MIKKIFKEVGFSFFVLIMFIVAPIILVIHTFSSKKVFPYFE